MSDFCDFVPDDPSCQTAPEPKPNPGPDGPDGGKDDGGKPDPSGPDGPGPDGPDGKMDGDDDKAMTWEEFDEKASEYFSPMSGNLAYLSVAAGAVSHLALNTFVWHRSDADTLSQAASGSGNTDYYKLLH